MKPDLPIWHPSRLRIPQFGRRWCEGCQRQQASRARDARQLYWRCEHCKGARG